MTLLLETGNAIEAGEDFRGWIVGPLTKWAAENGIVAPTPKSLRDCDALCVKWYVHQPGDERKLAPPDAFVTLGILVSGRMVTDFTDSSGQPRQIIQSSPGDYIIWHGPSYSHRWSTETGATVVTVRWPIDA